MGLNILYSPGEQKVSVADPLHNRTNSAIAGLTDGGWVVTWTSNETTSGDIYERRYTKAGATSGGDIVVNSVTGNAQTDPAIAALANGGWAITWTTKQTGDENIAARAYNGAGGTSGSDLIVASGVSLQRHGSSPPSPTIPRRRVGRRSRFDRVSRSTSRGPF